MPVLDFNSTQNAAPKRSRFFKGLVFSALAVLLVLGSTFAANINLTASGNDRIEFGQGVARTVVCGESEVDVLLTPNSSFINAPRSEGGGDFFFTGVTLSNIPDECLGTSFKFRAYTQNGDNSLQLSSCATDGTKISAYFNGDDDATPTGVTDTSFEDFGDVASISNASATSFDLNWNGDCDGSPISATNIYRVTVESELANAPSVKAYNGHFYLYVDENMTWNQAFDAIELRNPDGSCKYTYRGMCGYFATITSTGENNFVTTKVGTNSAWIGAADNGGRDNDTAACGGWSEGFWRWVSGPERCLRFSAPSNPLNGATIAGTYQSWNGGEPNDAGGEDALQILSGGSGQWNDLPDYGPTMGFIVEFSSNYTP